MNPRLVVLPFSKKMAKANNLPKTKGGMHFASAI